MLSATSLRTRMRRMCVHIIVFVSVISALLPSGVAAQADARPGRFVIAPEPKARTVTTTEDMFYGQLTTGSTRSSSSIGHKQQPEWGHMTCTKVWEPVQVKRKSAPPHLLPMRQPSAPRL